MGMSIQSLLPITLHTVALILLGLYLLLSVLYAYDRFWNHARLQEAFFALVLCLLLPVVGFVIIWMIDYYARKGEERDYSEIYEGGSFFRDELKMLRPLDRGQELNRVPMGEALTINDYELRRKMVMDTLNDENTLEYLDALKDALENEDSETSHYASSIIMLLQTRIQNALSKRMEEYERNPQDERVADAYEQELYQLLVSGLLEKENLRRYFLSYAKLSDRLLKSERPEERYFFHRVNVCFEEKNFTPVPALLKRYLALYPQSEDAVLLKIQLCMHTKDRRSLEEFIDSLPGRPVVLTQKTLEHIRFFQVGR